MLTISGTVLSQNPVSWSIHQSEDKSSISIHAQIESGWHIYSLHVDENAGPASTKFYFDKSDAFELVGQVSEPPSDEVFDENFQAKLRFFENQVTFEQKVKVLNNDTLTGSVVYMACNEDLCLPPQESKFKLKLIPPHE